jgi:hypothetical protein
MGVPGAGVPGAGVPGAGEPGAGEPGAPASPPPTEPEPLDANIGMKPENGDGDTVGLATPGRKGSTSAGTLRSCVPGRASSRIADCSSTVRAWIQSWTDATAPAATAPA